MFEKVRTAVHLYNAALRQLDALSQFLCFYRVFENLAGNNGKAWIESTLGGPMDYVVPVLCARQSRHSVKRMVDRSVLGLIRFDRLMQGRSRFNVIEVPRARALRRLSMLRQEGSDDDTAKRLYNANRCGIVHGASIRRHDFSEDFRAVALDLPLIRFLARLAIEEAVAANPSTVAPT